jgi:glycosyltransferase involved in cell wall biosynthesis
MPELARQCTVYCHPSYGEPLGNSALEVMACGKPIVGTNAGGLGLLIQEQGGRKVPPRDAKALAAALIEILESPQLQGMMGAFNRRLLEGTYSWDQVVEQLESVYQTVLIRRSGATDELPAKPFLRCGTGSGSDRVTL